MSTMKNTSVRLKKETLDDLKRFAEIEEREPAWLMRKAIEDMVEVRKWQIEQSLDTLRKVESGEMKSWTHEEVTQWLKDEGML